MDQRDQRVWPRTHSKDMLEPGSGWRSVYGPGLHPGVQDRNWGRPAWKGPSFVKGLLSTMARDHPSRPSVMKKVPARPELGVAGGLGERGEETEKYKWEVTEQSPAV